MTHRLLSIARVLFAGSVLALPIAAHAFKIDTHLWVAQQVYNDVADDGKITVNLGGRPITIAVPPDVASAITSNRDAYLMGSLGPDALPDVLAGQTVVHPGLKDGWKTNDWLTHILNKSKGNAVGTALAYGYLSHASADVFSHTYVNQYSGDIFLLFDGETLVEQRHMALEAFIGKHNPPFLDASGHDLGPAYGLVVPRDDVAEFVRDTLIYDPQASAQYSKTDSAAVYLPVFLAYRNLILNAKNSDPFNRMNDALVNLAGNNPLLALAAQNSQQMIDYLNNHVIPAINQGIDVNQAMVDELNRLGNQIDNRMFGSAMSGIQTMFALQDQINALLMQQAKLGQKAACTNVDCSRKVMGFPVPPDPGCLVFKQQMADACTVITATNNAIDALSNQIKGVRDRQLAEAQKLHDRAVFVRNTSLEMAQGLIDLGQILTSNVSPVQAIMDNWLRDFDLAMKEYVKAASNTMINTMNPAAKNLPYGSFTPMAEWVDCYSLTFAGIPSALGPCGFQGQFQQTMKALTDMANTLDKATALGILTGINPREIVTSLQNQAMQTLKNAAITELKTLLPQDVQDIIQVLSTDMTDANLDLQFTKAETPPIKNLVMFPETATQQGIATRVKAEMHLIHLTATGAYDPVGTYDPGQYAVVYDAIVLSKLALLDNAGLAQLAQQAGVPNKADGTPVFDGIDNVIAHAVASIDGNHQWMSVAPPYPNSVGDSAGFPYKHPVMDGYPWPSGYSSAAGLQLWAPEVRGALFRSLFIGPLTPGVESPEDLNMTAVLPADYPYRPCKVYPFPNDENDKGCLAIKSLPAILNFLLY